MLDKFKVFLIFALFSASPAAGQITVQTTCETIGPPPQLFESHVRLITDQGPREFTVEFAVDRNAQARGLMCREEMAMDQGMLFLFDRVEPRSFWMRNTLISLDIIFIDAECRVLNIAANAVPLDETSLRSEGPAPMVLEINGGLSALLGIMPGDVFQLPGIPDHPCGVAE